MVSINISLLLLKGKTHMRLININVWSIPQPRLLFEFIDSRSNHNDVFPSATKALNVTVEAPRNAYETKTSEH